MNLSAVFKPMYRVPARLGLCVVILMLCRVGFAGDPVAIPIQKSSLPRGRGLAFKSGGMQSLRKNKAVLFVEDFESGKPGEKWDEVRNPNGNVLSLKEWKEGETVVGTRSLMVTAHLKKDTGGGMTKWFDPSDDVFVRFNTRFDSESDYIHHFVTLRANRGLNGGDRWSGFGGAGSLPDGKRRFSIALEPWGNWRRWPAPGRWNFYSYWHEMKSSPDGKYWGNSFRPEKQQDIKKDEWICCEFMLRHNTPGRPDGEQAFWINGELRGHWKGFNWRTDKVLKANALTLESYVTDRWTKNPTNIVYFDNLVIASQYIGPEK